MMGSMGMLLADWSVELFRARRKKAKKAKMMEKMERMERVEKVEEMTDVMVEEEDVEAAGKVGNTEKIVASREVETSTGQLSSRLEGGQLGPALYFVNFLVNFSSGCSSSLSSLQ